MVDDGRITEGEYNVEQITANAIVNLAVAGVGVGDKIGTGSTKWIGNEFAKNVTKNLIQQNVDGLISSVVYESWMANDLKLGIKNGWESYTSGGWLNASVSSLGQGVLDTYDTRTMLRDQQREQMKRYHKTHKSLEGFNRYDMSSMSFTNKMYYSQMRIGMSFSLSLDKYIYDLPTYIWNDLWYPKY